LQTDFFSFFIYLLLFWFCFYVIAKLVKLEKRGWDVGPVWFMARTTRLNRFINRIALRFPRFWKVLMTIGIGFGFGGMVFTMVWLGINLYTLITAPAPENALVPFIPGVTVTGSILLYMILPIAIIMLGHEIAHGIAARIDGITVKSSGFLALFFLFGAFVEIDDEQASKKNRLTRQRIFAAGSFINLIIAMFSLIFIANMYKIGQGAYLYDVQKNGPSYDHLSPNEIIIQVNGTEIIDQWHLSGVLDQFKPFDPVLFTVKMENGTLVNRTVIPSFNHTAAYNPWSSLEIHQGTNLNGNISSLSKFDQAKIIFESIDEILNFSLIINVSNSIVPVKNFTALFVDLGIIANSSSFSQSVVFIINYSNFAANYGLFSLQNLLSGINVTGNITRTAGYALEDYFNASKCLALNFVFNSSSAFRIEMNLCKLYILTNRTESYFGITTTYNVEPRELALLFGPLAPHIQKMGNFLFSFSFAVGLINLLPIPPFDGDKLFVSLFEKAKPESDIPDSSKKENDEESKSKPPKPKEPWTWKKTVIWSVRSVAIFLFISNIVLSIYLFNVFTLFSSFFS
jgi:membrane-associated protease RseP (regulator of RpoE activity)